MSASGMTLGDLNFNNSSSAASSMPSRGPVPLTPVADAGNNLFVFMSCVECMPSCHRC